MFSITYLYGEKANQHTPPLSINTHCGYNSPQCSWGQHSRLNTQMPFIVSLYGTLVWAFCLDILEKKGRLRDIVAVLSQMRLTPIVLYSRYPANLRERYSMYFKTLPWEDMPNFLSSTQNSGLTYKLSFLHSCDPSLSSSNNPLGDSGTGNSERTTVFMTRLCRMLY